MVNSGLIGEQFDFFGMNLVVDSVSISEWSLFSDRELSIVAHGSGKSKNNDPFGIKRVIFNGPATIVFWLDGTKTVVKCAEGEANDKKTSILWAYAKKICGTSSHMNKVLDKLVEE